MKPTAQQYQGLPPAYGSLRPQGAQADQVVEAWEQKCREASMCGCGTRCQRNTCLKRPNTWFLFEPEIMQKMSWWRLFRDRKAQPNWRAILSVKARNVARLMRDGLSLSSENVVLGEYVIHLDNPGFDGIEVGTKVTLATMFKNDNDRYWRWFRREDYWPHSRKYRLENRAENWIRTLFVFSPDPTTVIDFDLRSINERSTLCGWALRSYEIGVKPDVGWVFNTRGGPKSSFNTVFPGLLKWWTWPGDQPVENGGREERVKEAQPQRGFKEAQPKRGSRGQAHGQNTSMQAAASWMLLSQVIMN